MKKQVGIIYSGKNPGKDEKLFQKLAKKKNIEIIFVNISKEIDELALGEKLKNCKVVYNNTAEDFGVEYAKTMESLGKKVIDPPKVFYFTEDKWMFFLKCKKHNISTPETVLLCENISIAKKELKKFAHWPVILKRISGTMGEYVEQANNLEHAEYIIRKFWKKGAEKLPIIAQEMIKSPSYRVTVIGGKIVQTALKENKAGWKSTGVYEKKFKKFLIDKELKKIINKLIRISGIQICGVDLLKKNGKWVVLEINSEPAFDFFENERGKLISLTLNLLKKYA